MLYALCSFIMLKDQISKQPKHYWSNPAKNTYPTTKHPNYQPQKVKTKLTTKHRKEDLLSHATHIIKSTVKSHQNPPQISQTIASHQAPSTSTNLSPVIKPINHMVTREREERRGERVNYEAVKVEKRERQKGKRNRGATVAKADGGHESTRREF